MFCKHDWKVLSETLFKSDVERANELGYRSQSIGQYAFQQTRVVIVSCNKCGKLKKFKDTH